MRLTDVTLREGDQLPDRDYTTSEKVEAGRALDRLGVSVLQVGFPITGEKDRRAIAELAATVQADVSGLARALPRDVDAALEADADIVDLFSPVSDAMLEHMIGKTRTEMLAMLKETVEQVQAGGARPHINLVDAFRADIEAIVGVFESFPEVPCINLTDTVGARTPTTVRAFLDRLGHRVSLERVGVHFHDDIGVATANTLAAYDAGVGRADVSVASLGERVGNACLEEVVIAAATDHDDPLDVEESVLIPTCRQVLETLGERVDPRKPILGTEAFDHEAGLHTAVMLDSPSVFEAFDPARFGGTRRLLFGAQTGQGGARKLLERAGIEPTDEQVSALLEALAAVGPVETPDAVAIAREQFDE